MRKQFAKFAFTAALAATFTLFGCKEEKAKTPEAGAEQAEEITAALTINETSVVRIVIIEDNPPVDETGDNSYYTMIAADKFEKLGIKTVLATNKVYRYVSFVLDNGENHVVDMQKPHYNGGDYLYKKGEKPMEFSLIDFGFDDNEDGWTKIRNYLGMEEEDAEPEEAQAAGSSEGVYAGQPIKEFVAIFEKRYEVKKAFIEMDDIGEVYSVSENGELLFGVELDGSNVGSVDIRSPKIKTDRGISVGSTAKDIRAKYDFDGSRYKGGTAKVKDFSGSFQLGHIDGPGDEDILTIIYLGPSLMLTTDLRIAEKSAAKAEAIPAENLISAAGVGIFELGKPMPSNAKGYDIKQDKHYFDGNEWHVFKAYQGEEALIEIWLDNNEDGNPKFSPKNKIDVLKVYSGKFATAEGIRVGSTAEEFAKAYPDFMISRSEDTYDYWMASKTKNHIVAILNAHEGWTEPKDNSNIKLSEVKNMKVGQITIDKANTWEE